MKVFVYGHYDSRGGTTAIACDSREQADEVYNEELFSWSETKSQLAGDSREAAKAVTKLLNPELTPPSEDDFLYEAELVDAPEWEGELENDDPEWGETGGEVWIKIPQEEVEATRLSYKNDEIESIRKWAATTTDAEISTDIAHTRTNEVRQLRYIKGSFEDGERVSGLGTTYTAKVFRPDPSLGFEPYDPDELARPDGWIHPRWDDDAYSFVLMSR